MDMRLAFGRQGMHTKFLWVNHSENPRKRWEDNIKLNFKKICRADRKWMELSQDSFQRRALVLAG
jgi:hypothetical protein